MLLREISQHLLLGHFFICYVSSVCVPLECLTCNKSNLLAVLPTETCPSCIGTNLCDELSANISLNCKKVFSVSVSSNQSTADEGKTITMICLHNLTGFNLEFKWKKDGVELTGQNESRLVLKKVFPRQSGKYTCSVNSTCGTYESSPLDVTVNDNSVIIVVVCVVLALALVLVLGLAMKYKLKRDNAKYKERMRQRTQSTPATSHPK